MGVAGRTKYIIEGIAAGSEFGGVRLGVYDSAVGLDSLDHDIGLFGHVVFVELRTVGRSNPGDIGQVLDRHRDAGQHRIFSIALARSFPGAFKT